MNQACPRSPFCLGMSAQVLLPMSAENSAEVSNNKEMVVSDACARCSLHSFLGYSAHSNQLGCDFAACSVVAARKPQLPQQYNYNVKGVPEATVRVQLQL